MSRISDKGIGKIAIIIFGLVFFIFMIYLLSNNSGIYYSRDNKKENGIAFLYELFQKHYKVEILEGKWEENIATLETDGLVLAIADSIHMDQEGALSFLDYIRKGGKALFISSSIPIELEELLLYYDDYLEEPLMFDDLTNIIEIKEQPANLAIDSFNYHFFHKDLAQQNISIQRPKKLQPYRGVYNVFYKEIFAPKTSYNILPLGGIQGIVDTNNIFAPMDATYENVYVNFVRFSIGEGYLYYNLLPELFTNSFLSKKEYLPYFNNVFAHFETDKIIWASDILRKAAPRKLNAKEIEDAPIVSSMEFIYKQTNLRNAWYVMLLGGLVFIVFKGKRKQRIVPVLPKAENNSKEFIRNIANLYYSTANYGNIAIKLVSNFVLDINNKYHLDIKAGDKIADWQIEKIAKISAIDLPALKALANNYNTLLGQRFYNIDESKMKEIYKVIQQYYKLENQAKELLIN